jgi:hypothetical protein
VKWVTPHVVVVTRRRHRSGISAHLVQNPFGHRWGIVQHLRDVPAEEINTAAAAMFGE